MIEYIQMATLNEYREESNGQSFKDGELNPNRGTIPVTPTQNVQTQPAGSFPVLAVVIVVGFLLALLIAYLFIRKNNAKTR